MDNIKMHLKLHYGDES